jgi:uncharacterized membrane protein
VLASPSHRARSSASLHGHGGQPPRGRSIARFGSPRDKAFDRLERGHLVLFHCRWNHDRPAQSMRRRARTSDEGKFFILVLTSLAAIAAIAAIIAHLAVVKDLSGTIKGLHIGLAAATIVSAWFFIHLTYALHYAHEYFDEYFAEPGRPAAERGGLAFPGTEHPDYYDFLYFSYVIGVACQTADVNISSPAMRRVALVHCVLAFFFNSAVLALTINIAAGLI